MNLATRMGVTVRGHNEASGAVDLTKLTKISVRFH